MNNNHSHHKENLATIIGCNIIVWFNVIAYFYINAPIYDTKTAVIQVVAAVVCTICLIYCLVARAKNRNNHG